VHRSGDERVLTGFNAFLFHAFQQAKQFSHPRGLSLYLESTAPESKKRRRT
jgi:hypothetical protein